MVPVNAMETPPETALGHLLASELRPPFQSARLPTTYFVHHASPERLPEWMRLPDLGDAAALRRMCPFADVSVNHCGVHFQAILPGTSANAVELLMRFGLTLSFSNVSPAIPGARAWLDGLADELGVVRPQVDVGIFVSAPGQGLVPHFDAYDAFVVQLHGTKKWRVGRRPAVESPLDLQYAPGTPPNQFHAALMGASGLPETDPTDLDEVDLEPGSVLFVPRGTWHTTTASNAVSVSASVFLNVPTIGELLLEQLYRVIAQDVGLRAPAFGFAGDAAQRKRAAELFERAIPALAKNVAKLTSQAAFEASAAPTTLKDRVCHSTRFLRDPSRRIDVDATPHDDGLLRLHVADTPRARPQNAPIADLLVLPPKALPIVTWILERRGLFSTSTVMEAFPMFDLRSIAGLLSELVMLHVLLLVPFGPSAASDG
jgi:hypothetical protein